MKYYIPSILCGGLILWLSVTSEINLPESLKDFFSLDKLGHAIAYGVFAGSIYWARLKSKRELCSRDMIFISLGAAFYGFLMETIQYCFFPGRYFEVLDILANIMGIAVMHLIFKQLLNKTTAP